MLVDYHTIVREGLRGIMEDEKDKRAVAEAEDGAKAIDLARRAPARCHRHGVNMPTMGGIEATRRIVAEIPNIRVIGLSFHDRDDMAAAIRRAGAYNYASKDAATAILCDSIRAQMRG